ncbi:AhpC/TSA family protein [Enhydrobacter aerosaccus]|uniref:AhpC/TSA family protein n=1 Tax=Enhydrobacter aerosaccus TaxID=225324 RepID=A0A1T4R617_9HYPH|nr:AhpC/TSA family protein [Enhydrobacter aerosaccus]
MWQHLYDELKDKGFMVVAVAEESRGADHARPWIEQAKSSYWQLIDTEHRLSDLYNLVNVPQAIWIDEEGRIVRPPETAGSTDHFRRMDLKTKTMSPQDQAERLAAREAYLDAVRAWVRTGQHALPSGMARAGLPRVTPEIAEARAHFRLGVWLRQHGRTAEGDRQMAEASRLYPESWSMWRQAADLDEVGKASGPEFWARVQALGDRPYYPPPKL